MQKKFILIFLIFSLVAFLFSSCTFFFDSKNDRAELVQQQLERALGGSYNWISETKINKNSFIEYYDSTLDEGTKIAGKIDYTKRSINSAEFIVSTDYLCKVFAEQEEAEYNSCIYKYFDEYKIVVKTSDRFCPIFITEDSYGNSNSSNMTFENYMEKLHHLYSTDCNHVVNNETDIYIVARSLNDNLDKQRMEATFSSLFHSYFKLNGIFCIADSSFTNDFKTLTENSFTPELLQSFKNVYTFKYEDNYIYE